MWKIGEFHRPSTTEAKTTLLDNWCVGEKNCFIYQVSQPPSILCISTDESV